MEKSINFAYMKRYIIAIAMLLPTILWAQANILKVGVLLPFEKNTDRGTKMVEFYRGFLMAADSIRKEGLNIDVWAWESGSTKSDMTACIESNRSVLSGMDIIFGPADVLQIPPLADFCTENGIKLVLPFSNGHDLMGHPLLYKATPSTTALATTAGLFVSSVFPTKNYIIVHTGEMDEKGKTLTETISVELAKWRIIPKILDITVEEPNYDEVIAPYGENFFITDNASVKSLNIFFSTLSLYAKSHEGCKISLLGYPDWQAYTGTLLKDFFRYDTYIYSNYYFNPLSEHCLQFQRSYERNFGNAMQIGFPRYSALGFDLGYYFLSGKTEILPYQNNFSFVQDREGCGSNNTFIQLIHFTPQEKIELIRHQ